MQVGQEKSASLRHTLPLLVVVVVLAFTMIVAIIDGATAPCLERDEYQFMAAYIEQYSVVPDAQPPQSREGGANLVIDGGATAAVEFFRAE